MTVVGILGAGQLGRMLALAGYPLGLRFRFLDPSPVAPAGHLAQLIVADFADLETLDRFAVGVDAVTYEFENVPVDAARWLADRKPVFPPPAALEAAGDRLPEKQLFQRLGIPTAPFAAVDSAEDLSAAIARIGFPAVLKTRRLGYDGKGQTVIRGPADLAAAWETLGSVPLLLEGFLRFERELSLVTVRGRDGAAAAYPLVENHHRDGILRLSVAPAPGAATLQALAEDYGRRVLESVGYVGVLAIEFFEYEGRLVANEMAPRVHNSGHWTIEGAEVSQFENHLRAVVGWPLGSTAPRGCSAMVNLIGATPTEAEVLRAPGAHLHLYGKSAAPGRKLGHATVCADDFDTLAQRVAALPVAEWIKEEVGRMKKRCETL
jgi:5-(carboxyamino)imidazole ribonucleotide synthase